ncbi:MAG: DUF2723 domain-containing protein [Bacteroidaceae bacterium]|nr:DUF2723 domain-containing protein [Bacteroidaceae bacterium]
MKQYKLINNLVGWLVFAIAAVVYCLTIESSASFWDCPEFITTGYKLEVGHPPGAPFFMLTANLFSQLASDPSQVAYMVNVMSALLSAGCILFLFWSITHLTRRLLCGNSHTIKTGQMVTIIGAGLVGALAYTFSDTFWYSAVESEVYAYSSFFTAVVFWFILKWEEEAGSVHSDRWLILIAYLMGLSVGVHLLNLLCIPAIVLIYYFKKNPNAGWKGTIMALAVSAALVAAILYGIVPGIVKVGGWFELFFVNTLSMPFNTGLILYIVVLVGALVWSIWETYAAKSGVRTNIAFLLVIALTGLPFYGHGVTCVLLGLIVLGALAAYLFHMDKLKEQWRMSARVMSTALVSIMMIVIGYSSYAVIVVRSAANTPMDQNSPEDIFTLGSYLNREQYGDTPLFYGGTYASKVARKVEGQYWVPVVKEGAKVYIPKEKASADEKDQYIVIRTKDKYVMEPSMLFPRMHSADHANWPNGGTTVNLYDNWVGGIQGREATVNVGGQKQRIKVPTQWDNIKFFINYQVNFMYWRYFMWNFVGRQNDIQGHGEIEHGNWITGIDFIDKMLVGDQTLLPSELRDNKGRNVFYGLPLLLGLIGLFWQAGRGKRGARQFWVVFMLFFMTGLAIVLYLNQTPMQPRERDYAYAASFYAFAIWIGMGVAGIAHLLQKLIKNPTVAGAIATVVCVLVPLQMASQTWDDHDRSNRYMARDFGQNYLNTLPEKGYPIIFTNGDNDTFPLWYNQEVEGMRTDSRVCNLSYLQTDWYIDQMRRPAYDSPSVPIQWERLDYVEGPNDAVEIRPEMKGAVLDLYKKQPAAARRQFGDEPFELRNVLDYWVKSKDENLHYIPTDTVYITLDKAAILRSGMYIPEQYRGATDEETMAKMPDRMVISLKNLRRIGGRLMLTKNHVMLLEMLANTNWERPLYMSTTVGSENYVGLDPFFLQEGLAYRITPFNFRELGLASGGYAVDSETMYDNLMNRFVFGGMKTPGIYIDETITRMGYTHRRLYTMLASQLIREGKKEKALAVLNKCDEEFPASILPHNYWQSQSHLIGQAYLVLGETEKGMDILGQVADNDIEYITWYLSLDEDRFATSFNEVRSCLGSLVKTIQIMEQSSDKETLAHYSGLFDKLYQELELRVK